jgi:LAO/AO transport system kinase
MQNRSVDNRILCADARKIAEDLKIPYKEVGDAANELGIRIMNCQLGCF